jgi:pyruvate carboxylase
LKAAHAIELPSASSFLNIDALIDVVKKNKIDAVHPGYGFLSESDVFAKRVWEETGATVIGPGWDILASTGDKMKARQLAESCKFQLQHPYFSTVNCHPQVMYRFLQPSKRLQMIPKLFVPSPLKSAILSW